MSGQIRILMAVRNKAFGHEQTTTRAHGRNHPQILATPKKILNSSCFIQYKVR